MTNWSDSEEISMLIGAALCPAAHDFSVLLQTTCQADSKGGMGMHDKSPHARYLTNERRQSSSEQACFCHASISRRYAGFSVSSASARQSDSTVSIEEHSQW